MNITQYLNKFEKFTKDPTLKAMEYIMEKLENPDKKLKYIHVAGTNGKGSICEMLNSILVKQGYKVGKFMSPHLIDFKEIMTINNIQISEDELEKNVLQLESIIEEYNKENSIKVKWFEVITSIAINYFANNNCDIVILETGLGGTVDCTNIVNPLISVIGNIGYDHMDILGSSIGEIATHKAGIIKENGHTVFVEQEGITEIIEKIALSKNNKLHVIKKQDLSNYSYNQELQTFDYKNLKQIGISLKGEEQIYNAAICLECMSILEDKGFNISENSIKNGLKTVVHKGRFEILRKEPTVIFDGGHNENAIKNLKRNLNQYYPDYKKVFIVSLINTKDYKSILKYLLEDKEAVYFFTDGIGEEKYIPKETLYNEALQYGNRIFKESLENAIKTTIKQCRAGAFDDPVICITGSFYKYAKTLEIFKNMENF